MEQPFDKLITGGCHCGKIKYSFEGNLKDIAHCHCSICRKTTGGIVTTWITILLQKLNIIDDSIIIFPGDPYFLKEYKSSETCCRYFCKNCGCSLFLHTTLSSKTIDISIATLDHPNDVIPDRHIWFKNKIEWLKLDEHLPVEQQEIIK